MSVTTNTLAGPETTSCWDLSIDQELHIGWTKTWGPDSFNLYVRGAANPTTLSGPLRDAIANTPGFNLEFIP